jgi:hypothetical protein
MTGRLMVAAIVLIALQTFSSRTVGVRVDVLVTNGRMPVGGLTAADFELRDNGVLQSIEIVDSSGPINVVLALDVSARARVGVRDPARFRCVA